MDTNINNNELSQEEVFNMMLNYVDKHKLTYDVNNEIYPLVDPDTLSEFFKIIKKINN